MPTGIIDQSSHVDAENVPAFEDALMRLGHFISTPFRAVSRILKHKINPHQDVTVGSAIVGSFAAGAAFIGGARVTSRMDGNSVHEMLHSRAPLVAYVDQACGPTTTIDHFPVEPVHRRAPNVPTLLVSVNEMGAIRRLDVAQFGRAKKRSDDSRSEQIIESIAGSAPDLGIGHSQSSTRAAIVREFVPTEQTQTFPRS